MNKIRHAIPATLLVAGMACFVLAACWTGWFPPERQWAPEDAKRLANLSGQIQAMHKKLAAARARGVEVPEDPIPLLKLRREYEAASDRIRQSAAATRQQATLFQVAGVGASLAGVTAWAFTKRRRSPSASDDAAGQ